MPLFYKELIEENCIWGIWEITETIHALSQMLGDNVFDSSHLQSITHEGKKTESMAVRVLTQYLLGNWRLPYKGIQKDGCDKPHLAGYDFSVSVSHTSLYAAVIIHRSRKVGIDIEQIKTKLIKVAPKFLSPAEITHAGTNLERLCMYWCAKEVLYKKYGKKNLSLKDEIYIHPFQHTQSGPVRGEIMPDGYKEPATIVYMKLSDYILAYSYE
ncbi:4'-phosphopantetheinyl transferase superfamily protein [Rhodocytophaga rosea]|uniref:4'-phosphopantetheinyl transferase superfamily protein n=1 Tax=Rhodocytophaga rosea TaxID=2704465 RepID=A0A6C0GQE8_9BACT|nr:4'-phosphopantetheinyl transferase superfamily protein [Rhodocytophaga rosea]QHT70084.1 4'-phosphopantetheinyl transferase superfamily protein [Rhodocytophaga rosea]